MALGAPLLGLCARPAAAESAAARRAPLHVAAADGDAPARASASPSTPPGDGGYATPLTVGYVLAPLLAIPVGAGLFELTRSDTVAVVGAGLAVVSVPVIIHAYHDEPGRGAVSALLLPTVTVGALGLGVLIGATLGSAGCHDDSDCELAQGIDGAIAGGLIGGVLGYTGYAIYDATAHSSGAPSRQEPGAVGVWALPVLGRQQDGSERGPSRIAGAMAGAALTF